MFKGLALFDKPLNRWDVSKVVSFKDLFEGDNAFNQPLNAWDTSSLQGTEVGAHRLPCSTLTALLHARSQCRVSTQEMFSRTTLFNQPLNGWNVGSCTYMAGMFIGSGFNQPLQSWNTARVTGMHVNHPTSH